LTRRFERSTTFRRHFRLTSVLLACLVTASAARAGTTGITPKRLILIEQAALGYLHANCANCHNDTADGIGFLGMNMPVTVFSNPACTHRIAGMDVADSCVHFRMSERGTDTVPNASQMPPLASDLADPTGLAAIAAWIATLPAP
jgi:hypothetical protein